jgi:uncharacterized RDD family membrane protein YckC
MNKDLFSDEYIFKHSKKILRKRVVASAIDYLLVFLFTLLLPLAIGHKTNDGYKIHGILSFLPVVFWIVYFIIIEKIFLGTFGKILLGIKVESLEGAKLKFVQVLKRRLADFIEIIWCFGLVAYVKASNNADNKRIGDLWANTRVVSRTTSAHPNYS